MIDNKVNKTSRDQIQICLNVFVEKCLVNFVAQLSSIYDVTTGSCCSGIVVVDDVIYAVSVRGAVDIETRL